MCASFLVFLHVCSSVCAYVSMCVHNGVKLNRSHKQGYIYSCYPMFVCVSVCVRAMCICVHMCVKAKCSLQLRFSERVCVCVCVCVGMFTHIRLRSKGVGGRTDPGYCRWSARRGWMRCCSSTAGRRARGWSAAVAGCGSCATGGGWGAGCLGTWPGATSVP